MTTATKAQIKPGKLLINGEWVEGKKHFDTINPATGEVLTQVADAGPAEVDQAAAAARKARIEVAYLRRVMGLGLCTMSPRWMPMRT